MTLLQSLRDRWGGGIRPSIAMQPTFIERCDGDNEGPDKCISFEAFGITSVLFIGRTPPPRNGGRP